MQQKVFAVRDNKSSLFQSPIVTPHLAEITRGLETSLKNPKSMFATHPQDFELYQLGSYETETGKFKLEKDPVHVLNFIDLKHQTMGDNNAE